MTQSPVKDPSAPNVVPNITYRQMVDSDVPIVKEMYTLLNTHFYSLGYRLPHPEDVGQAWLDSFYRTLGRFSMCYIAEMDGEVAGFILCRIKRVPGYMGGVMVGELSDEWIIPAARRHRIGDKLCRIALEWLREQNVHSVEIQVLNDNDASWRMLTRMGFKLEFRVARLTWDEYEMDVPNN